MYLCDPIRIFLYRKIRMGQQNHKAIREAQNIDYQSN